jgi:hypothetical protein
MRLSKTNDELTTSLIPIQIANNVLLLAQFAAVGLGAKIVLNWVTWSTIDLCIFNDILVPLYVGRTLTVQLARKEEQALHR